MGLLVGMGWKWETSGHQHWCCSVGPGCVALCLAVLGCAVLPCPLHNTSRGFNLNLFVCQRMSTSWVSGLEVGNWWLSLLLLFGGARVCCLVSGSVVAVAWLWPRMLFADISKTAFEKAAICLFE